MFLMIFSIIITTLSSQNIWELSSTIDNATHRTIRKFEVVDSSTVFFGSTGGSLNYLFKSENKGKTWFKFKDLSPYKVQTLTDLKIFDSIIYVSFFDNGVILKSNDYGESFNVIDLEYNNIIYDLVMFDEKNEIANMPVKIYKTADGWENFDTIQLPFILNSHVIKKYNDSLAYGILSNFGKELEESKEPNKMYLYQTQFFKYNYLNDEFKTINFPDMSYLEIEFTKDSVFYLCGKKDGITGGSGHDAVFKSTNAGKTWRTILDFRPTELKMSNVAYFGLQDIAFKNDSVGIAVGQFGKILYTYDGGKSWIYEQKLPKEIDSLSPPTMLITYAGDQAILGTYTGHVYTLKEDKLAPKPEDTLTISGKIISEDSLAITHIPIRLNNYKITMTDGEGNYKFTKLSPGSYTVTAVNKYIDSGPKEEYHYEPYLYSPAHSFELTSDTSGIDFESEVNIENYFVFGTIFLNDEPIDNYDSISVKLENVEQGKDTLDATYEPTNYSFQGIKSGTYTLRPVSDIYTFEPEYYKLVFNTNYFHINFISTPTSSVKQSKNFEIRNNILISKEFAGMQYHIFSLTSRVVKSGILPKELNLNAEQTGTYILHITKGEQVIYSHKFQVVR